MPIDKKSEEWLVMRYFREKYTDFPNGKLVKAESPDFVLKLNRKKSIGIELSCLDYLMKDNPNHMSKQLIKLLEKKKAKLSLYKKKIFTEYWLILSADDMNLKEILRQIGDSNFLFERVFLFNLFSGEIIEI